MITSAIHTTHLISNDRAIQATSYYPYGLPMAESSFPDANRHKYSAKELVTHRGYDAYDFGPRNQLPTLCIFDNPDLLQEKFYGLHPSSYCAANPTRNIDPTGMEFVNPKQAEELKKSITNRKFKLKLQIENKQTQLNLQTNEKSINKLTKELNNLNECYQQLETSLNDIQRLEKDANKYELKYIGDAEGHHVKKGDDGIVYIEHSSDALAVHEIRHVSICLEKDNGALNFNSDNYLKYSGKNARQYLNGLNEERLAYRAQYAFAPNSLPQSVSCISEITFDYISNLKIGNNWAYPNLRKFNENYIKHNPEFDPDYRRYSNK